MKQFKALKVVQAACLPVKRDEKERPYYTYFYPGDDSCLCICSVIVKSEDSATENEWVAKIEEIRMQTEGPYFLVSWYFSAHDIVERIKASYCQDDTSDFCHRLVSSEHNKILDFLAKQTNTNERYLSNEKRTLWWETMLEVISVLHYDESSLDPPQFTEEDFFTRRSFDLTTTLLSPGLDENACTLCHEGYDPFPLETLSGRDSDSGYSRSPDTNNYDPLHFCPNPTCRKWYHRQCLLAEHTEHPFTPFIGARPIRLLAVDPDAPEPHFELARFTYPVPPRGKFSQMTLDAEPRWDSVLKKLTHLPPGLVRIAQQPIVKRAGEGTDSVFGNLKDVVLARRICYQELEGGVENVVDEVTTLFALLDGEDGEEAWRQIWHTLDTRMRPLASPYTPYWDNLLLNGIPDDASFPTVTCPSCQSAI
ncbi:unnamed protein product [Somion occarium]|uniref:BAH domain-containing protein n=1 Tax=Somion occarium TaxID=3059160 RepID=A0ABP1DP89_9APHY